MPEMQLNVLIWAAEFVHRFSERTTRQILSFAGAAMTTQPILFQST